MMPRLIFYCLTILVVIVRVDYTEAKSKVACDGQIFYIYCSYPSKLVIRSGLWGRASPHYCKTGTYKNTGCHDGKKTVKKVQQACNGQRYCRFTPSQKIFGNPCSGRPGVSMYLHIDYKCVGPPTPPTIGPAKKTVCNLKTKADIYFLIDSSGSVRKPNFVHLLRFVNALINSLTIGQNGVRVGVIRFSTGAQLMFPLNRYYTKAALRRVVRYIPFVSGSTATASTLNLMRTSGFTRANGARPKVPKVGILITDGIPNNLQASTQQANLCKQSGIEIFCVAAQAPGYAKKAIRNIASNPHSTHSFIVDKFSQMTMKAPDIARRICSKLQPTTTSQSTAATAAMTTTTKPTATTTSTSTTTTTITSK